MKSTVFIVLAMLAVANVSAEESFGQQRARISAQKAAVERAFIAKERECEQRFVVTSCMNEAQKERRAALGPLRQEELRIDTIERKQRAAVRTEEIEAKQRADAAKDAASAPEATRRPFAARAPTRPASAMAVPAAHPVISAAERSRREMDSEAQFQERQAKGEQRRAAAAERNAKRAASGKVARPLPVPAAAASSP